MSYANYTFSVLVYRSGTFVRQETGLSWSEARDACYDAKKYDGATRCEIWNEYHDQLEDTI